ncbi:hypothetical protein Tco_1559439, partial [Tanacetum coccineum]
TDKLLTFKNVSPADNEIASLMDTIVCHEEPSGQTSTLFIVPITVILTTIPLPPHFFDPLPQQATPTPTPTTSEATTSFPTLLDFSFVFKFNDRVTKFETNLSEMKQVDQYAQAISSIPAIVDHYINNNLGEAIHKAIQSHNAECREEAQAKKQEDPKSKESKSTSSSKGTSCSHHKSSGKSAHAEEPSHTVDDSRVQKNQEFDTGSLSRHYLTSVTKTKATTYEIKWIEDMVPNLWSPVKVVYDKHAY